MALLFRMDAVGKTEVAKVPLKYHACYAPGKPVKIQKSIVTKVYFPVDDPKGQYLLSDKITPKGIQQWTDIVKDLMGIEEMICQPITDEERITIGKKPMNQVNAYLGSKTIPRYGERWARGVQCYVVELKDIHCKTRYVWLGALTLMRYLFTEENHPIVEFILDELNRGADLSKKEKIDTPFELIMFAHLIFKKCHYTFIQQHCAVIATEKYFLEHRDTATTLFGMNQSAPLSSGTFKGATGFIPVGQQVRVGKALYHLGFTRVEAAKLLDHVYDERLKKLKTTYNGAREFPF